MNNFLLIAALSLWWRHVAGVMVPRDIPSARWRGNGRHRCEDQQSTVKTTACGVILYGLISNSLVVRGVRSGGTKEHHFGVVTSERQRSALNKPGRGKVAFAERCVASVDAPGSRRYIATRQGSVRQLHAEG